MNLVPLTYGYPAQPARLPIASPIDRADDAEASPALGVRAIEVIALLAAVAVVAAVALYVSLPAAAIAYAAGYVSLTWFRPDLALLLMFAAAPFPYDLGGGPVKMAAAEVNLVLAFPVLLVRTLVRRQPIARNPILWPVLLYFGVCVASSALNGITVEGVVSMGQMAVYLLLAVFVFSSCVHDLRLFRCALAGLIIAATFQGVLAAVLRAPYVLGVHKNAVGTNLAYALIAVGDWWMAEADPRRRRRLIVLACVLAGGLFFSLSRGAWVGAAAGLLVVGVARQRYGLVLRGAVVAAVVVAACWTFLPDQQRAYATDLHADSYNIKARLVSIEYAFHFFESNPMLGAGVGLRKQYDATNVIMSTLAETGATGLLTFALIFGVFLTTTLIAARRASAGDARLSLLAIGAGMTLCQLLHGCVDHYWSRVLLVPWACAGMAVFARDALRRAPFSGERGGP